MPVKKCSNGKWRIGDGDCIYETKAKAEEAQRAIKAEEAKKHMDLPGDIKHFRDIKKGNDMHEVFRFTNL